MGDTEKDDAPPPDEGDPGEIDTDTVTEGEPGGGEILEDGGGSDSSESDPGPIETDVVHRGRDPADVAFQADPGQIETAEVYKHLPRDSRERTDKSGSSDEKS